MAQLPEGEAEGSQEETGTSTSTAFNEGISHDCRTKAGIRTESRQSEQLFRQTCSSQNLQQLVWQVVGFLPLSLSAADWQRLLAYWDS